MIMGFFVRIILLFALAVVVALSARFNPGNVVLFYPPYRIDMSLNLFALIVLVLVGLVWFLFYTVSAARDMPERVAAYRRNKVEREANDALREALKAFFEGRFGHAEKAAMRAFDFSENKALAALIGARVAHHMGQADRRDAWLAKINNDNQYQVARLVTSLELFVDAHQPERALEVVDELNAIGTRHIHVLRWALKANQQAKHWNEVLRLVKTLDKYQSLHPVLSMRLRELAYHDLLTDRGHDAESIRRLWQAIPTADRVKPSIAAWAAHAMVTQGLVDNARQILEKALHAEWDGRLIVAYREAVAEEGSPALLAQIEHCEVWLKEYPADPELLLTMGALCLRQKLWGKAQRHLEQALRYGQTETSRRAAMLMLARLHEELGEADKAAGYYRNCAVLEDR